MRNYAYVLWAFVALFVLLVVLPSVQGFMSGMTF